ncbi:MAG TPA: DUF222 domain-containing protein [Streptosporangiaceae bacterium]|nr:DUF222 domain-containing protein [Streptosporangiaceae bacterium]
MCDRLPRPTSVRGALDVLGQALDYLNTADLAALPVSGQAEALKSLEAAEAKHTAARSAMLSAFSAGGGPESDGHGAARVWLRWQTRVTRGAAAGAVAWMRRLAAHPVIGRALAAGEISASWARELCALTDRLPAGVREDADQILCQAAAEGAGLADLARLAEAICQRTRGPDADDDDRFGDRYFHLGRTIGGVGRAQGDLTPGCTAALSAVLDALGKKAGPEDLRTAAQRRHDALEDACRRLIATGMLPARGAQPTQVQVHLGLAELRDLPGAAATERAWIRSQAAGEGASQGRPGWLTGAEAQAAVCDATFIPVVTGQVDPAALGRLTGAFAAAHGRPLTPGGKRRLARALLGLAIDTVSGPGGLAAALRTQLAGLSLSFATPLTSVSLPLDVGAGRESIPVHLRRAVTLRHPHCAFPGCRQPAGVCDVHHLVPRAAGGVTALHNLVPLCRFHHLIAIHHWGWALRLNPDGTTTATSPDGRRMYHSHSPPGRAA